MNLSWQQKMANAVKLAAKIREKSYDQKASDRAFDSNTFVDYSKFYKKSIWQASDEATKACGLDKIAAEPIYLLLKYTWNDILDWADRVIKEAEGGVDNAD